MNTSFDYSEFPLVIKEQMLKEAKVDEKFISIFNRIHPSGLHNINTYSLTRLSNEGFPPSIIGRKILKGKAREEFIRAEKLEREEYQQKLRDEDIYYDLRTENIWEDIKKEIEELKNTSYKPEDEKEKIKELKRKYIEATKEHRKESRKGKLEAKRDYNYCLCKIIEEIKEDWEDKE